jgi:DNA invertase Pin-like site-specific DNA recombinase
LTAVRAEVASSKRKDRPKLADALVACRVHSAKLIIAKLDRLDRNVAFVSPLMEAGVEFEAVDFPQANRLTIHILAAVAEHEAMSCVGRLMGRTASCRAPRLGMALLPGYLVGSWTPSLEPE